MSVLSKMKRDRKAKVKRKNRNKLDQKRAEAFNKGVDVQYIADLHEAHRIGVTLEQYRRLRFLHGR